MEWLLENGAISFNIMKDKQEHISIKVEESVKRQITNPEYLLQHDKIIMKNGDIFLVTEAETDHVELMMVSRKILKKENLQFFIKHVNYVVRADCFEKG